MSSDIPTTQVVRGQRYHLVSSNQHNVYFEAHWSRNARAGEGRYVFTCSIASWCQGDIWEHERE